MSRAEGASGVSRRRRHRGGGILGGGVPSLIGHGSGEGALPPPQKFFSLIFCLGMVHFSSILTRLVSSQGLLQ